MAFCVRSERNIDFNSKDNFPGPGQYLKLSPRIILNNKRKFPPFFTSAKRTSFVKLNDIPGPGSYNLNKNFIQNSVQSNPQMLSTNSSNERDENNFQITNFNSGEKNTNLSTIWQMSNFSDSSKLNNFSTKNKSYSSKDKAIQNSHILKIYNNNFNINKFLGTNIGFLSQANRFDSQKKDELNLPGPGYYYESILSSKAEKKIKNKIKNGKIFDKSGSLSRIVSIPSKTMNGYIFKNIENEKTKSTNNSFIKNSEKNNINNTSFSSFIPQKEQNLTLKNDSGSNLMTYNNKFITNEEDKIFDNKFQLLINERQFGSTTNTTTSEFIGPGTYDVSIIEKKNNAVNWSKGFDLQKISKKNNIIKKAKLLEEMKKNGDYIQPLRTFHGNIRKIFPNTNKVLLLYNLRKIKNNILQNKLSNSQRSNSFIPDKSQIPGPGYYDKDIFPFNKTKKAKSLNLENGLNNNSKKTPKLNYIKYIYGKNKIEPGFGSFCEREMNKSKSLQDLSPFSYFKDKNKFERRKKNTLYKNLILGKTDMSRTVYNNYDFYSPDITNESQENDTMNFESNLGNKINNIEKLNKNKKADNLKLKNTLSNFSSESEKLLFKKLDISSRNFFSKINNIPLVQLDNYKYFDNNPGPGDYNLSHKFIKKSFSTNQMMQSKTERFKEISINENPGPGTYRLEPNLEKKFFSKKIIFKKAKTDLLKEQKIKKIIERNKRRNEIPGVGLYNIDKRNSLVYKVHLKYNKRQGYNSPFLISSSRFNRQKNINELSSGDYEPYKFENIQKNNQFMVFNKADRFNKDNELLVGPGSYKLNPQWNKKSYNKLFTPNNEQ